MSATADDLAGLLRPSIERYADQAYSFERRAAILHTPGHCSAEAWADYAEFGWLALRLPQDQGGFAADAATLGVVMENVGAHLLMEPLLASALLGTGLVLKAAGPEQQAAWLPLLAAGRLKLAFAHEEEPGSAACVLDRDGRLAGVKTSVLHGDIADRLLLSCRHEDGRPALCIVGREAPGLHCRHYRLVDGRGASRLELHQVQAEVLAGDDPTLAARAIADAVDEACVALCAEAVGIIRSLVSKTAQYLNLRKQFGKPIGSNQALQHRMADMYLLQQEAIALTARAQDALASQGVARARIISGSRAYIAAAVRRVAGEAMQMHGGIGITEELDVSHYFRRAMVVAALFGNRDVHFERFASAATREQS